MLRSICPIFPSSDFDRSAEFYAGLGFMEIARFKEEGYLILARDAVEIHFFKSPSESASTASDHGAFVRVEDAVSISAEYAERGLPSQGIPRFAKAEGKPWGICELEVVDPDGNLLRMGHVDEAQKSAPVHQRKGDTRVTRCLRDKGVSLAYRDIGPPHAQTLVFIHAMSFHQDIWRDVISQMPSGLRIVTYDQRGHGASNVPALPYTLDDYADDAIRLLDHLEVRSCCLIGISFGGLVAQRLAKLRPGLVERLVLSNTALKIGVLEDWIESADAAHTEGFSRQKVESFFPELFSEEFCQSSPRYDELVTRRMQISVEGYLGCCQAIGHADLSNDPASRPTQPALVIGTDDDVITPRYIVEELAASLPNCQFQMIKGAAHLPCVDKPKEFADLVISFLDL